MKLGSLSNTVIAALCNIFTLFSDAFSICDTQEGVPST